MNNVSVESFINFCDEMIITEEAMTNELSQKQLSELYKNATTKYIKPLSAIVKKVLSKHPRLKKYADGSATDIYYDKNNGQILLTLEYFDIYAITNVDSTEKMYELLNNFEKDIISFEKDVKKALSKTKSISKIFVGADDWTSDINSTFSFLHKYIDKYDEIPSNPIIIGVIIDKSNYNELIPSDDVIKENEKKRYLQLYEAFIKFLKSPYKLGKNIWSAHIADICRIMGMSSDTLNMIISKNIKAIGPKTTLFQNTEEELSEDAEWEQEISNIVGDCYIIDEWSWGGDKVVYSIPNKKLYWICSEHSDFEVFYNNFPYNSKEFEDALFDDDPLYNEIRQMFTEYNIKHNIKYFN